MPRSISDLRKYQVNAVEFMSENNRAALFMTMGTGKTISTLTHLHKLTVLGKKTIILSSLQVAKTVWHNEATKWMHTKNLRFSLIVGSQKDRHKALKTDADIYVMNVDNIKWFMGLPAHSREFDVVVLDELTLWKSRGVRWKAVRKWMEEREYVYGLTGTPAPNGLLDLWAQMELIKPGVLGRSYTSYRRRYFYPTDYNQYNWVPKYRTQDKIFELIEPLVLRVSNDELDMPALNINPISIPLPKEVYQYMQEIRRENLTIINGAQISAASAAVGTNKLAQLSNGCVYDDEQTPHAVHSEKLKACTEIVESLQGNPVVIAYSYVHDAERIMEQFPQAELLNGKSDSDDVINRWNAGEIEVLVMHPAAGGHGLNIQEGGHNLIWYGMTWNLEHYEQLIARLWRQGQTHDTVHVHLLLGENTIDQVIADALQNKSNVQQACLDYFATA